MGLGFKVTRWRRVELDEHHRIDIQLSGLFYTMQTRISCHDTRVNRYFYPIIRTSDPLFWMANSVSPCVLLSGEALDTNLGWSTTLRSTDSNVLNHCSRPWNNIFFVSHLVCSPLAHVVDVQPRLTAEYCSLASLCAFTCRCVATL